MALGFFLVNEDTQMVLKIGYILSNIGSNHKIPQISFLNPMCAIACG